MHRNYWLSDKNRKFKNKNMIQLISCEAFELQTRSGGCLDHAIESSCSSTDGPVRQSSKLLPKTKSQTKSFKQSSHSFQIPNPNLGSKHQNEPPRNEIQIHIPKESVEEENPESKITSKLQFRKKRKRQSQTQIARTESVQSHVRTGYPVVSFTRTWEGRPSRKRYVSVDGIAAQFKQPPSRRPCQTHPGHPQS